MKVTNNSMMSMLLLVVLMSSVQVEGIRSAKQRMDQSLKKRIAAQKKSAKNSGTVVDKTTIQPDENSNDATLKIREDAFGTDTSYGDNDTSPNKESENENADSTSSTQEETLTLTNMFSKNVLTPFYGWFSTLSKSLLATESEDSDSSQSASPTLITEENTSGINSATSTIPTSSSLDEKLTTSDQGEQETVNIAQHGVEPIVTDSSSTVQQSQEQEQVNTLAANQNVEDEENSSNSSETPAPNTVPTSIPAAASSNQQQQDVDPAIDAAKQNTQHQVNQQTNTVDSNVTNATGSSDIVMPAVAPKDEARKLDNENKNNTEEGIQDNTLLSSNTISNPNSGTTVIDEGISLQKDNTTSTSSVSKIFNTVHAAVDDEDTANSVNASEASKKEPEINNSNDASATGEIVNSGSSVTPQTDVNNASSGASETNVNSGSSGASETNVNSGSSGASETNVSQTSSVSPKPNVSNPPATSSLQSTNKSLNDEGYSLTTILSIGAVGVLLIVLMVVGYIQFTKEDPTEL